MSNTIKSKLSSPAKTILFGEHAVVYGTNAIAISLDLRTFAECQSVQDKLILECPDIDLFYNGFNEFDWSLWKSEIGLKEKLEEILSKLQAKEEGEELDKMIEDLTWPVKALENLIAKNSDKKVSTPTQLGAFTSFISLISLLLPESTEPNLKLSLRSEIPVGCGLGSSASFAVSLSGSLLRFFYPTLFDLKNKTCLKLVNKLGFMAECILHGNPSGIDNTVSAYGGLVLYKSGAFTPIDGLHPLMVLITNTNVPRNTKKLVQGVRDLHDKYPKVIKPIISSIDGISLTLLDHIKTEGSDANSQFQELQSLISINQTLLELLGVSHPSIENVIKIHSQFDLACKLTGAGGGGCTLSVIPSTFEKLNELVSALKKEGYQTYLTKLGGEGIRVED